MLNVFFDYRALRQLSELLVQLNLRYPSLDFVRGRRARRCLQSSWEW